MNSSYDQKFKPVSDVQNIFLRKYDLKNGMRERKEQVSRLIRARVCDKIIFDIMITSFPYNTGDYDLRR